MARITIYLSEQKIDIRVSFLPTAFGESVVMRILKPSSIALEFRAARHPRTGLGSAQARNRQAQRHDRHDRADRLGQDDHALRDPPPSSIPRT